MACLFSWGDGETQMGKKNKNKEQQQRKVPLKQ